MNARQLIPLLLAVCLTNCAAWRSQIDPNARRYDQIKATFKDSEKKTLLLRVSAEHKAHGEQGDDITDLYKKGLLKSFQKSGLFKEVGTDISNPDLELVLNIAREEHFNKVLTFFCGFTLLIVPAYDRVSLEGNGTVHNAKGDELGKIRIQAEMKALIGWVFLPTIPTYFVSTSRFSRDVVNSVLVQMMENKNLWQ